MHQFRGLYFPDGDVGLPRIIAAETEGKSAPEFDRLPTFQFRKFAKAFPLIRNFRHAVDVGAHVGLWSRVLSRMFAKVTAIEPMPQCVECFEHNIRKEDRDRVVVHQCALGNAAGELKMHYKSTNSGYTHAAANGEMWTAVAKMHRMDEFLLMNVDFLKIDCEGFEQNVVAGGEETIRRCKPTIIVEQKPGVPQRYGFQQLGAVAMLQSWGATLEFEWSGDYCLRWR
jgi:FkbM family methyltransferase